MHSNRLKWLRINAYRHVEPGTRLEFGPGVNVLLGRNGTGKTTLLELLDMIWSRGFAQLADEVFDLEYAVECDAPAPACTIEVSVKNELLPAARPAGRASTHFNFSYRVAIKTPDGATALLVEGTPKGATLTAHGRTEDVEVLGPYSGPILWAAPRQFIDTTIPIPNQDTPEEYEYNEVPWSEFRRKVDDVRVGDILSDDFVARAAEWAGLFIDLAIRVGRFDESLGAFHALTSEDPKNSLGDVRWQIKRRLDDEAKVYRIDEQLCNFVPHFLLQNYREELSADVRREPPEFRTSLRQMPVLAEFLDLTTYTDAFLTFRHHERRRDGIIETLTYRAPEFTFMLPGDGGDIKADALSYGEKRLLAFLWYLACNSELILADELVNGFHHEWITACLELIPPRQAFLTSQNPLLLDALPLESVDDARRSFITCHRDPQRAGRMQWSNITQEQAEAFYRAYEREILTVNEILRGQGLW
jgi:energy-coupling factor transporter ATP-binding protein EcfA2